MRIRSSLVRWLSLLFLLYAQAVMAIAPCISHGGGPADAFGDMPEDCPKQMVSNLCVAHCQISDGGDVQTPLPVLSDSDAVVLWLPRQDCHGGQLSRSHPAQHPVSRPPPLLLICSLNL